MDRCPTCQARLREGPVCGRCQTDLSLPLAAEAEAEACVRLALERWLAGDAPAARRVLERSLELRRAPLAEVLLAFFTEPARPAEFEKVEDFGGSEAPSAFLTEPASPHEPPTFPDFVGAEEAEPGFSGG